MNLKLWVFSLFNFSSQSLRATLGKGFVQNLSYPLLKKILNLFWIFLFLFVFLFVFTILFKNFRLRTQKECNLTSQHKSTDPQNSKLSWRKLPWFGLIFTAQKVVLFFKNGVFWKIHNENFHVSLQRNRWFSLIQFVVWKLIRIITKKFSQIFTQNLDFHISLEKREFWYSKKRFDLSSKKGSESWNFKVEPQTAFLFKNLSISLSLKISLKKKGYWDWRSSLKLWWYKNKNIFHPLKPRS